MMSGARLVRRSIRLRPSSLAKVTEESGFAVTSPADVGAIDAELAGELVDRGELAGASICSCQRWALAIALMSRVGQVNDLPTAYDCL